MTSIINSKKIYIFCQISKKIGGGHLIRSERLLEILNKNFECKLYVNCSKKKINKILFLRENKILIFDYKDYSSLNFLNTRHNYYIFFDNEKKFLNRSVNICPLIINKKKFSGPKWFLLPKKIKKSKKSLGKNLLIAQGLTDAHNNLTRIVTSFKKFFIKNKIKVFIRSNSKRDYGYCKTIPFKDNFHEYIHRNINFAITSVGNLSYELNYMNIPCLYISSEKKEIIRARKLNQLNVGKFLHIYEKREILNELKKLLINIDYRKKIIYNQKKNFKKNTKKIYLNLIREIFNKKFQV
jgi:spore coat polysaccharide biosynthesis predicted glycosyltransferase SpsG